MQNQNYELSVLINGRPIKKYGHNGLTFVEGRKNTVYTIKFKNNTAAQVLAIVSVDGLSVVDGKPATASSRGYIVPAYSPVEIKGWRVSEDRSSDFVFSDKPTAYSTQSQGQDINCGVVSVKVIAEKVRPVTKVYYHPPIEHHHHHHYPPPPVYKPNFWCGTTITYGSTTTGLNGVAGSVMRGTDNSSGADNLVANNACFLNQANTPAQDSALQATVKCMAMAAPAQDNPDFNLGTGWGKEKEDRVTEKEFERNGELCTISIFYTDAEGLKKVGIDTEEKPAITKVPLPQGFGGFCVPPKLTAGS